MYRYSVQCTTYLIEFGDEAYLKAKVGRHGGDYKCIRLQGIFYFVKICTCPSGHRYLNYLPTYATYVLLNLCNQNVITLLFSYKKSIIR